MPASNVEQNKVFRLRRSTVYYEIYRYSNFQNRLLIFVQLKQLGYLQIRENKTYIEHCTDFQVERKRSE